MWWMTWHTSSAPLCRHDSYFQMDSSHWSINKICQVNAQIIDDKKNCINTTDVDDSNQHSLLAVMMNSRQVFCLLLVYSLLIIDRNQAASVPNDTLNIIEAINIAKPVVCDRVKTKCTVFCQVLPTLPMCHFKFMRQRLLPDHMWFMVSLWRLFSVAFLTIDMCPDIRASTQEYIFFSFNRSLFDRTYFGTHEKRRR